MLANLGPKERLGYAALIALALGFTGYIGGQNLKKPAPIVYEQAALVASEKPSLPQASDEPASTAVVEAEPEVQELVVHVAGAVKKPGVARLKPGARVQDALASAGGALADADLDSINLAGKLTDGVQIYVPKKKQDNAEEAVARMPEELRGGEAKSSPAPTAPSPPKKAEPSIVNLNTATQAQLESLPGIGPVTARSILEYRKAHGGFGSVDELLAVKGIGPKKLEAMRKFVRL
jgi:competence protein ComEA